MISSNVSVDILISICELRTFQFWPEFKFRSPSLNFPVTLLCQPRVKSCCCLNFNWTKYIDFFPEIVWISFLMFFGFLPETFWILVSKSKAGRDYYSCNCILTFKQTSNWWLSEIAVYSTLVLLLTVSKICWIGIWWISWFCV